MVQLRALVSCDITDGTLTEHVQPTPVQVHRQGKGSLPIRPLIGSISRDGGRGTWTTYFGDKLLRHVSAQVSLSSQYMVTLRLHADGHFCAVDLRRAMTGDPVTSFDERSSRERQRPTPG